MKRGLNEAESGRCHGLQIEVEDGAILVCASCLAPRNSRQRMCEIRSFPRRRCNSRPSSSIPVFPWISCSMGSATTGPSRSFTFTMRWRSAAAWRVPAPSMSARRSCLSTRAMSRSSPTANITVAAAARERRSRWGVVFSAPAAPARAACHLRAAVGAGAIQRPAVQERPPTRRAPCHRPARATAHRRGAPERSACPRESARAVPRPAQHAAPPLSPLSRPRRGRPQRTRPSPHRTRASADRRALSRTARPFPASPRPAP